MVICDGGRGSRKTNSSLDDDGGVEVMAEGKAGEKAKNQIPGTL